MNFAKKKKDSPEFWGHSVCFCNQTAWSDQEATWSPQQVPLQSGANCLLRQLCCVTLCLERDGMCAGFTAVSLIPSINHQLISIQL